MVYMQAAIEELKERGHSINEADFVHLSSVQFKHINRYGKFRFDLGKIWTQSAYFHCNLTEP